MKSKKENDYPQVDLLVDYLAWSNITGKILDAYGHYPCKIKAGVFALCLRGTVRVMINLTEYVIHPHDLVFLIPGSFIEVRETSAETRIAFVGFSSNFMNTLDFRNVAAGSLPSLISNPIIPLSDKVYRIYKDVFRLISRTLHTPEVAVTHNMMTVTLNMLVESISGICGKRLRAVPETRDRVIFLEFMQMAFTHYRQQHKVSFYARAAQLTLSHFCAAVNKASGMTAREIIIKLIIMDAKGQLGGSTVRINKIAESLGFDNPTTFARYFKEYVGMTPQEYRNTLYTEKEYRNESE